MEVTRMTIRLSVEDYKTLVAAATSGKYAGDRNRVAAQRYAENVLEHHAALLRQCEEHTS